MTILFNLLASNISMPITKKQASLFTKSKGFVLTDTKVKPFYTMVTHRGEDFAKIYWSYESKGTGTIEFLKPEFVDTYLDVVNA
jgi:hypothetical protein